MISTLIVEDDYHVATIHAAYVRKVRGFSVAAHASTAASARSEIRRLAPTLVLLDLYLPDGHGLDLVREFLGGKAHRPDFLAGARPLQSASRETSHLTPGPREPCALPEYLGAGTAVSAPLFFRLQDAVGAAGDLAEFA